MDDGRNGEVRQAPSMYCSLVLISVATVGDQHEILSRHSHDMEPRHRRCWCELLISRWRRGWTLTLTYLLADLLLHTTDVHLAPGMARSWLVNEVDRATFSRTHDAFELDEAIPKSSGEAGRTRRGRETCDRSTNLLERPTQVQSTD